MISDLGAANVTQPHQWISFVEGSANEAPDPSAFPVHVLGADHNLNNISGGDPTDGFTPWVTDILVYPTSEYWETLLDGDRVRPYFDLSISEYNTLRVPSAVHNYDLYVDTGKFYEDVNIDGGLQVGDIALGGSDMNIPGDLNVGSTVTAETLQGFANTKIPVSTKTADFTFDVAETGYIYQCKPAGAKIEITLPGGLDADDEGIAFTVNNNLAGKTTEFPNLTNARGTVLGEQFSSCTIYWDGTAWYGIGDLV
jgi:hypothetical protein